MARAIPEGLAMTYAEYLVFEEASEEKHEYVDGRVVAMSGGTFEHSRLAAAFLVELSSALRGRPCVPLTSDMRVRIHATGRSRYPDVSVVCGAPEFDPNDRHALTNPVVIVEVLSAKTRGYARPPRNSWKAMEMTASTRRM